MVMAPDKVMHLMNVFADYENGTLSREQTREFGRESTSMEGRT